MRTAALVRCQHTTRPIGGTRGRHRQVVDIPRMMRQLLVPLIVLIAYLAAALMAVMGVGLFCLWVASFLV